MKRKEYFFMLLTVCIALVTICTSAYAFEASVRSHGNVVFESVDGEILLCGEDMTYLLEKVSSIPDEVFDPEYYGHIHVWEYDQVDSDTHIKKCKVCDESALKPHTSFQQEETVITYKGSVFSGTTNICDCGFQWVKEMAHNLRYVQEGEKGHIVECELSDTKYCDGRDEAEEAHSYILEPKEDYKTHLRACTLCGYKKEEECDFVSYSEKNEDLTITWYCECGNSVILSDDTENPPEELLEPETILPDETEEREG